MFWPRRHLVVPLVGLAIASGLLVFRGLSSAYAHELRVNQMGLWPDRVQGTLRGELLFDPELTRSEQLPLDDNSELAVLQFLRESITLHVDGRPVVPNYQVRELWVRGGATTGDLVVFSLPLVATSRSLKVGVSDHWQALVVSIQQPTEDSRQQAHSWFLKGGEVTPPFSLRPRLQAPFAGTTWNRGGPEQYATPSIPKRQPRSSELAQPEAEQPLVDLFGRFLRVGFQHILPNGSDHILFIVALALRAARCVGRLLLELSLFTLAHTVSLALASLGVLRLSSSLVEPLIALSLVFVGIENVRSAPPAPNQTSRRFRMRPRLTLIFGFGLIHGMGFASALEELPFVGAHWAVSLLGFNGGIELGQMVVALSAAVVLRSIPSPQQRSRYLIRPGSLVIAATGFVWALQRWITG